MPRHNIRNFFRGGAAPGGERCAPSRSPQAFPRPCSPPPAALRSSCRAGAAAPTHDTTRCRPVELPTPAAPSSSSSACA